MSSAWLTKEGLKIQCFPIGEVVTLIAPSCALHPRHETLNDLLTK